MDIGIVIAIGVVMAALGFAIGRSSGGAKGGDGASDAERRIRATAEAIARGKLPQSARQGSAEAELYAALEKGWAPREAERQAALREAIGRVSSFLNSRVREPLDVGPARPPVRELRARMDQALGALSDLDFFLEEPAAERVGADLIPLVQKVAKEFAADHEVGLRLEAGSTPVRASVNQNVLMDALYLVMHNAERFSDGATIDVAVGASDGRSTVTVRDRGRGFSEEAFKRAFDPFYSTSSEGLGLGLPHARGLVEGMGGRIELRNVPDGGAEVEVSFPSL